MSAGAALQLRGIVKRYGRVAALSGVDLTVAPGEIHAILGENGAGKTTLMHVAYGLVRPDAGSVSLGAEARSPRSPRDARRLGAGLVHQHFTSIPSLTVADNIVLAAGWRGAASTLRRSVTQAVARSRLPLDVDAMAGALPVASRQRLEIVKALAGDARLLLLDEPTAVLGPAEAEELLAQLRAYAAGGTAIVLITHKLDEALAIAHRVTVLRRGAVVLEGAATDLTGSMLATAMIGAGVAPDSTVRSAPNRGVVRVMVTALDVEREDRRGPAVRGATLSVAGGEVVGVVGVEGSGQRELLRAVAGRIAYRAGTLVVTGTVGFIPEDRTTEGLIPAMSLTQNLVLGSGADADWMAAGRIAWPAARRRMAELLEQYGIRVEGPDAAAATLSGGNQQKVVIARELDRRPAVLVAENPTRGLDIRAAAEVHHRLRAAARDGAAVLVASTDLDEVLAVADRAVVMAGGRLIDVPAGAGRAAIGALMLGAGAP